MSSSYATPEQLAQTRNAGASVRHAQANGWQVKATYAVTLDGHEALILVKCYRYTDHPEHVSALWTGEPDSPLSFDGAWHRTQDGTEKINYTQFGHILKGTTPKPRPANDAQEMLAAIDEASLLPATAIWVIQTGRPCSGKAPVNLPGMPFLPCANFTASPTDHLCPGPCVPSLTDPKDKS